MLYSRCNFFGESLTVLDIPWLESLGSMSLVVPILVVREDVRFNLKSLFNDEKESSPIKIFVMVISFL